MSYRLGVDLGTTYTAAAVWRTGVVEMVNLGATASAIPSVVGLEAGGFVVGDAAEARSSSDPDRTAREFKRRIGDPAPLLLGGSPYASHLLMARLLEGVLAVVTEREGEPPEHVTLTHPANWGAYRVELFADAVDSVLGDTSHGLVTEPEAAALDYAARARMPVGSTVAVYDLGGGTFDAAVLRREADGFSILGEPTGVERLGGLDFDAAILNHVLREAGIDGSIDVDPQSLAAMQQLRRACVEAKIALSSATDAVVPVFVPGASGPVRITRAEFEELISPLLDESISSLERAVARSGVDPSDLHAVLLVGGSSRIPVVGQRVTAALHRPVAVDADPKNAIARGASRVDPSWTPASVPLTGPTAPVEETTTVPPPVEPTDAADPATPPDAGSAEGVGDPPPAVPATPTGDSRGRRTSPALLVGAGVALLVLLVIAFVALSGGDDEPADVAADTDSTDGTDGAGDEAPPPDSGEEAPSDVPDGVPTCAPDSADGVLRIGVAAPQTGFLTDFTGVEEGARLAVDDINAAGGIDGIPLELVVVDSGDTVDQARGAFATLDAEGADVVVGPILSTQIDQLVADLPVQCMVTFALGTGLSFMDEPDDDLLFRPVANDADEAALIAMLAGPDGTVTLVDTGDDYAAALLTGLRAQAAEQGSTVRTVAEVADVNPATAGFVVVPPGADPPAAVPELISRGVAARNIVVPQDQLGVFEGRSELVRVRGLALRGAPPELADRLTSDTDRRETFATEAYTSVTLAALAATAASSDSPVEIVARLGSFAGPDDPPCTSFGECRDLIADGEAPRYEQFPPPLSFDEVGDVRTAVIDVLTIEEDGSISRDEQEVSRPR